MIRDDLLATIDLSRPGLEIGALHRPMVGRALGPVEYVDRASSAELRAWYKGDAEVDPAKIVDVDHVWGDQSLLECVGGQRAYAYVVTSHVIEHVPDLFGWLSEIGEVLVDGGVAGFVVPDKRYTFDLARRTSSPSEMIDAYVRRLRRPDPRQVYDHHASFRELHFPGEPDPVGMVGICRKALAGEYVDSHCWVFTPRSLLDGLELASQLGVLPFEIAAMKPTELGSIEFLLALRRLPEAMDAQARRAAFTASRAAIDLPSEGDETVAEAPALSVEGQQAIARVAAMEASTSWRITAPLRAAVTLLRGRRG